MAAENRSDPTAAPQSHPAPPPNSSCAQLAKATASIHRPCSLADDRDIWSASSSPSKKWPAQRPSRLWNTLVENVTRGVAAGCAANYAVRMNNVFQARHLVVQITVSGINALPRKENRESTACFAQLQHAPAMTLARAAEDEGAEEGSTAATVGTDKHWNAVLLRCAW